MTGARSTPDPAAAVALHRDLARAPLTVDRLEGIWGADAAAALHRGSRAPALRAASASGDRAAAALATLFVLGAEVDADAVDAALPELGLAGALAARLVQRTGGRVSALVDLRPYAFSDAWGAAEWWIASDPGELALGGALPEDHVLGIGGASTTLSGLLLPDRVGTALDLGTGCGIQALHAKRTAGAVVATDVSERALAYARFNAALNGARGIDFRLGSLYEPVAGERFDRVVSNPPFVVTPRSAGVPEYEYRDAGEEGDAFLERVVRGLHDVLAPGGVAQLLGNWEYRGGADGLERAAGWAEGLDAWIVERERVDTARYAETWVRDGGARPAGAGGEELVEAWLDDFDARGVTALGFGYLTLRRPREAVAIRRTERVPGGRGALSSTIGRTLDALDRLADLDDPALARIAPVVASDVTEERSHLPGSEHPSAIVLRQGGGFERAVPADAALAGLVGACDGTLSLGAIVAALADLLEVDPAALAAALLPAARELLAIGVLLLPDGDARVR